MGQWSNGTDTADYRWSVPETISPGGTTIEWGGTARGNISVDISASGEGIRFDPNDLRRQQRRRSEREQALPITVSATTATEVKLVFDASFGCIRATYTYRR